MGEENINVELTLEERLDDLKWLTLLLNYTGAEASINEEGLAYIKPRGLDVDWSQAEITPYGDIVIHSNSFERKYDGSAIGLFTSSMIAYDLKSNGRYLN